VTRKAAILFATWLASLGVSAAAVRVHFVAGGTMNADRAWAEGGNLILETETGSIGIPLDLVVRVESVDRPAANAVASRAPSPAPSSVADESSPLVEAAHALRAGDADRAATLFHRALAERPEKLDVRVGYALAEIARGRDPVALAAVLDGLALHPHDPRLLEILGDLRDREERVDDALRAWREAGERAPDARLAEKIAKAERELAAGRDYAFAATAHFTVRHEGDLETEFAGAILDFLEERWGDLTSAFRHAPSQPVTVILYPERAFRDVTQAPDEVGGVYDGKVRVPLGGVTRLDPALARVLSHELTHAIVHSKTRGKAPRWLHEGLAQWAEPRPLTSVQTAEVWDRVRNGDPADWDRRAFSYPAALSLVRWIEAERGFSTLVSLLDRLGEGVPEDEAFSAVYGQGYADLCRRWAESLGRGGGR
jgi:tetratricopeptide (TPR) repeat protein